MSAHFTVTVASTPDDVRAARAIREAVFVDEQAIPAELDADGLDEGAVHVLAWDRGRAVATGRLVEVAPHRGELARIAVLPEYRGGGLGAEVVEALHACASERGLTELTLHPHSHLERFYRRLGYRRIAGTSVVGEHTLITMHRALAPSETA